MPDQNNVIGHVTDGLNATAAQIGRAQTSLTTGAKRTALASVSAYERSTGMLLTAQKKLIPSTRLVAVDKLVANQFQIASDVNAAAIATVRSLLD